MAKLQRVWRAHEDGRHNAFGDLARWHDQWWLTFRNAESHASLDGTILVLHSADLENWEMTARIETEGDDRDPHFVVTDDSLWTYFGSWTSERGERGFVRSFCASSANGLAWSEPTQIYEPHVWLWRPSWLEDQGFSCAPKEIRPSEQGNKRGPLRFLCSSDGICWSYLSQILPAEQKGSETHLHRQLDGTLVGIVRWGGGDGGCTLVRSQAPYAEWETKKLATLVHAPCLLPVGDRLLLAGRCLNEQMPAHLSPGSGKYGTALWWLEDDKLEPALWLPSGGDNAYPGMALADDGSVIVSYYSQHEYLDRPGFQEKGPPASIYLAKVGV